MTYLGSLLQAKERAIAIKMVTMEEEAMGVGRVEATTIILL